MKNARSYMLGEDKLAALRLKLLDETYGPSSRDLLSRLIAPGMKVADFGCGPGLLTHWFARQVGPEGLVTGIDANAQFLEDARARTASLDPGAQVTFIESDVMDTSLPAGSFDLVFCRFLLVHLKQPLECLREMARLLRPGGWIVAEECEISGGFTEPASSAYQEMMRRMLQTGNTIGVDYDLGPKLPRLFSQLGFEGLQIHVQQPTFMQGEQKRFWEYTYLEGAQKVLKAGFTSDENVQRLSRKVAEVTCNDETVVGLCRSFQVWCRK